jgi:hypothetical protein
MTDQNLSELKVVLQQCKLSYEKLKAIFDNCSNDMEKLAVLYTLNSVSPLDNFLSAYPELNSWVEDFLISKQGKAEKKARAIANEWLKNDSLV